MSDTPLVVLYPSQLWVAALQGWTRGREYIVYKCLKCFHDMDRCRCTTIVKDAIVKVDNEDR